MDYHETVYKFLSDKNYFFKPGVVGVYMSPYADTDNALSLYIIMEEDVFELTSGFSIENDIKIEYSEININEIYDAISKGENCYNGIHLSMICSSSIIFDGHRLLDKLQDFIMECQNRYLLLTTRAHSNNIYKRIIQLQLYAEEGRKGFDYVYFNLIEEIRILYSKISGCADIPITAILKVYNNEKHGFYGDKSFMPDDEFISIFLQAIYSNDSNIERVKIIKRLYFYATRDIENDFNHYLVYLKDKK